MVAITPQSWLIHEATQNSTGCPSSYPMGETPANGTLQEVLFFLQLLLPSILISFWNTGLLRAAWFLHGTCALAPAPLLHTEGARVLKREVLLSVCITETETPEVGDAEQGELY